MTRAHILVMHNKHSEHCPGHNAVGAQIRSLRLARKIGLRELARRANVSPGFLHDVESGKRSASVDTLIRFADGLGVPHRQLILTDATYRVAKLREQIAQIKAGVSK